MPVQTANGAPSGGEGLSDEQIVAILFEYLHPDAGDDQRPRVIGAVSTSNTSVRVSFSEPAGEGADVAANYRVFEAGAEDSARCSFCRPRTRKARPAWC